MRDTMARKTISAAQLYAILDREFRKRRMPECTTCRVPLPFYRAPPDDVSANWHIGTPAECPHKCHAVIGEILAHLWSKYELQETEEA